MRKDVYDCGCDFVKKGKKKKKNPKIKATQRNANPVFDSAVARQMPTTDETRDW